MAPDFSYETEIVIDRSPEAVFGYVTSLEAIPEWAEPIKRVENVSTNQIVSGTTFEEVAGTPFGEATISWEVLEYKENRLCTFHSESFIATTTVTFLVEPARGRSSLKINGKGRGRGLLRLIDPLLGRRALRLRKESLRVIKKILESGKKV
ncbi:MAG: SRPBCC family protein [Anaerolineales bacterium]|nr:SRPBCC family protein [Anaerolineales bacterium]